MEKSLIYLNSPIGSGGEASIYTVKSRPDLVAKIYTKPNSDYAQKLAFMIANPPDDPLAAHKRVAIAWAVDLVTDSGQVIGFLMPKLDLSKVKPILHYYNPSTRRKECPLFHYAYLLRTARNLARVFHSVHSQGYVIGDVNESNVLVAEDAIPTLVDTDSFQVNDGATIYRCTVGKPEYTPSELHGISFRNVARSIEHDLFGLGVLIFQLLMEGIHPFDGVFAGQGEVPKLKDRIKAGHFPHGKQKVPYSSQHLSLPFQVLHPSLQQLFLFCFEEGHRNPAARPTAKMWVTALGEFEVNLTKCSVNKQHFYSNHLNYCPWCDRTSKLQGRDPFPSEAAVKSGQHLKPMQNTKVAATSTKKSSPAPTNPYFSPQQPLKPQYSTPNVSSSPPVKQRQSWSLLTHVIVTFPFCMILAVFLWQTFGAVMMRITSPSATKQNLTTTDNNQKTQETELQAIEARTGKLVNLFAGNLPVSAIIGDIRKRTPITVQVDAITQTSAAVTAQDPATSAISLSGKATSYNELNDFLQLLKASPLLKAEETVLVSSTLQPATADRNFTLVNFQIRTVVTSPTEALPYLQKIGADGLVTRVNLLKQQGVILANKSNIVQTIEEANRRNIFVLSLLPPVDNIDTVIRDIQDQIPKTIVFAVPPDFSYELAGNLRAFQPAEPIQGAQYDTYSFTIGFDGKFEDVLNSIQKIERLKPLLIVKDVKLTRKALPISTFRPVIPESRKKEILDSFPPLMGADFTLQLFVPKTLEELKATNNPPRGKF